MNAPLLASNGWAIAIRRDDGSEFFAHAAPGVLPAAWPLSHRRSAVLHKRELIAQGFKCRVVRVLWAYPKEAKK